MKLHPICALPLLVCLVLTARAQSLRDVRENEARPALVTQVQVEAASDTGLVRADLPDG